MLSLDDFVVNPLSGSLGTFVILDFQVWILSSPNPPILGTSGVWGDTQLWNDINVWYD